MKLIKSLTDIINIWVTALKSSKVSTKLSFFVMGLANFANGQIVKGILFLITEIAFIVFMMTNGLSDIKGMMTLGINKQGWVFDEGLGISVQFAGDNSMLMLIYGICAIFLCISFFVVYHLNLKSAINIEKLNIGRKKIPSFKEDIQSFLDERFHVTLLIIPVISVILFTVLPLIYMIAIALTSYDHNHLPPKNLFSWVGLINFHNVFNGDISGTFLPLLIWTLTWAVLATFTCFFFGVLLALFINSEGIKGKSIYRVLFVTTMAVPPFVSLLIMQNLLHSAGPINTILQNIGIISKPIPFLTDGLIAKVSIILVNMWIGIPVTMLVSTGIILNLPTDQLEAAKIDGASGLQIFKNITFPNILYVMTPTLIQQLIGNINNFNVIYLLTGGGPSNSSYYGAGDTDLLVTWLYKLTVDRADYNLASVIGIIIFVLSAAVSLLLYTRSKSYQSEGGEI